MVSALSQTDTGQCNPLWEVPSKNGGSGLISRIRSPQLQRQTSDGLPHRTAVRGSHGMHWIHTAFPVGHHGQMACAPCQRMLHTSVIRLLPVRGKGNGICHLPPVLFMTFFQCIQKAGSRRGLFLHGSRQGRTLITIRTDHNRHCGKKFHSLIGDSDLLRGCRIIRDLYRVSYQGRFRFIPFSTEADAGSPVDFPLLMMEKSFRYHRCIQKGQRTAVPVPLLKWGDPFFRNSGSKAFVVFCDTGMLLLMIVFLQIDANSASSDHRFR